MLDELVLAATIAEDDSLTILDDLVVTRRCSSRTWPTSPRACADGRRSSGCGRSSTGWTSSSTTTSTYEEHDRAFHDTIMQASGNRIARAVVQALESQVIHTARYVGRTERALCVASNLGHRRIYERIAAHDPDGAAEAMFTHITDAWLVRRGGPTDAARLRR